MRTTRLIRPEYSEAFRCIGPACEDSCCAGWSVPIDKATCERYQTVPAGPLRDLIDANLARLPEQPGGASPAAFAKIRMKPGQVCPFLNGDSLCRIQVEHGETYLSVTCATYPRMVRSIDGLEEKALSLSCPEAARLVLTHPALLALRRPDAYQMTWDGDAPPGAPLRSFFWPVREFVFNLLVNRNYPLWQRLFLLGTFCRRLDAIAAGGLERSFPAFLDDFAAAIRAGTLRPAMETIPGNLPLQLDMVLQLAGLCRSRSFTGPRFVACIEAFKCGIGYAPEATMQTLIDGYARSSHLCDTVFFRNHPYLLENYLINAMFRSHFPFGKALFEPGEPLEIGRSFTLLATQFALIKGLLIGVAGGHGEAFALEHAVHTIQSASKHFEHHPEFLTQAHALLVANGMESPQGLTMLLRN